MAQAGRPKSELNDLPENWQVEVLSLYQEGASDVEIKALIYEWRGSFSNNLWDRWMEEEPEFWETIKTGRILSEQWWAKHARTNLTDKDFNHVLWYMNMKNRFGWADKQEVKHEGPISIRIVEDSTLDE